MEIWYTPERMIQHQEINERRMARYERRAIRNARQRRRERVLGAVRTTLGYLLAVVIFYACLFFGLL